MSTLKRRGTRAGNRIAVWMYRTLDGRFFSFSKDVHVLMVTTPGRRTGLPRSTCVRYLDSDDDVVLAEATEVAKYAKRAGRVIPVAVLEPIEGT